MRLLSSSPSLSLTPSLFFSLPSKPLEVNRTDCASVCIGVCVCELNAIWIFHAVVVQNFKSTQVKCAKDAEINLVCVATKLT